MAVPEEVLEVRKGTENRCQVDYVENEPKVSTEALVLVGVVPRHRASQGVRGRCQRRGGSTGTRGRRRSHANLDSFDLEPTHGLWRI